MSTQIQILAKQGSASDLGQYAAALEKLAFITSQNSPAGATPGFAPPSSRQSSYQAAQQKLRAQQAADQAHAANRAARPTLVTGYGVPGSQVANQQPPAKSPATQFASYSRPAPKARPQAAPPLRLPVAQRRPGASSAYNTGASTVNQALNTAGQAFNTGRDFLDGAGTALGDAAGTAYGNARNYAMNEGRDLVKAVGNTGRQAFNSGRNLLNDAGTALGDAAGTAYGNVKNFANNTGRYLGKLTQGLF